MIKITLEFDNYARAAAVLALLDEAGSAAPVVARNTVSGSVDITAAAPAPAAEKSTRAKRDPAEVIAQANADSAARRDANPLPPSEPHTVVEDASPDAPAFDYATLRNAVNKIGAAVKPDVCRPALLKIANDLGGKSFKDLPEAQWPAAFAACQALAAEHGVAL